ncbi:acyl-CoA dehydrogenase [Natranaerobius thermophilus]|uniref:Butyryl-CoA dehydrogenase n=1 Tax=Natranaerobius thermophilus (strain ATCC BAA-1301 / DSM 18059 / JW/NM-WN-LF) TaxID=457570 RepID=B2A636_NATTJ|nr:acyl-CoA dehydrogenase [Natranaerobius thermophilus]ACB85453.1 butyryl-CoA dehydrogenase [Natranaerobius thermophilus JW/NM-WN-LF]
MNFELSNEHKMVQKTIREFAQNEVEPIAAEIDETERFPTENVDQMQRYKMMGVNVPKEYGGAGGDELAYAITVEELSRACATTGIICSAHTSLACWPILKYGTEEQKQKYLKPLASGEKIGAFGLTEPNAGSDAGSQETRAELKDDHYLINGTKIFITNGDEADTYIVFAMTEPDKGVKGISAFIVDRDTPGFSVGKREKKMGIKGSATTELIFENMKVPKENLLGKEGQGFKIAMKTLDGGRIGVAAQALGIAQGALDETVNYTKEREQFNRPIAKFQGLQFEMADMSTQVEAARLLVYRAAMAKAQGKPYTKEAAMAKLYASEVAMHVANKAIQLHGGYGYTKDYPVERMLRDAKITEIYEGTSEVQRMVISGDLLK